MRIKAFVLAGLLAMSNTADAARSSRYPSMGFSLMALGTTVSMIAYSACSQASADHWDMEDEDRARFDCNSSFKTYHDARGLSLYERYSKVASKSYSKLKQALIADSAAAGGSPEPPEGCDAHHIVPENEGRKWAKAAAERSRSVLRRCHIDINSAQNGVFLPNGKNPNPGCEGQNHPTVHTREYYDGVADALSRALQNGGCEEVKDTLMNLKNNLINSVP